MARDETLLPFRLRSYVADSALTYWWRVARFTSERLFINTFWTMAGRLGCGQHIAPPPARSYGIRNQGMYGSTTFDSTIFKI